MTEYPHWLTPAQRAVYIACAHISERTMADATPEEARAVRHDPVVQAAEDAMSKEALRGDVAATREAAQYWNRCCREALKRAQVAP
jgi:hypothetical protein